MKNKKLFTTLAALIVGSVVSTGVIFTPALTLANDHEKHDGSTSSEGEDGDEHKADHKDGHKDEHKTDKH